MSKPWVSFECRDDCWHDCTLSGCPGHTVECTRQPSDMFLRFVYEDGREKFIPEAEFEAMMKAYLGK